MLLFLNHKSSYRFAKTVGERLQNVTDLKAKGIFDVVAEKVLAAVGALRPNVPAMSLERAFN